MKRPLQLSLAIALALSGTNALALGLGPVHVKSKLNQPLDAEIPIIQGSAGEAEGLLVNLAAAEDFERVGINRSRLTVPLSFALGKGSNGQMVIKVTSTEAVRDTYLDFLVEANWPKGRLLREYTVLLDPPITAPARGATTSAVAAAPAPVTVKRHDAPAAATPPAPMPAPRAMAKAATPAPAPAAPTPSHKVNAGEYGPVDAGETLSGVAHATKVGGANVNQMMLALLKNNPNAFYKDNVNALKRGAILRIPSADEVKAMGSASEAAAQIHAQVEDWRGGRATPTRIADAGSEKPHAASPVIAEAKPTKSAAAASKAADEHLALVPPKAGKDSLAMADRPGAGAGSAAATTELKSELARTKETLTTREQESGELKSRVKELEGIKDKNDRLIGLKDSEIADLQQKLKQLQEKPAGSSVKSTTIVAPSPATSAPVPVTPPKPAPPIVTTTPPPVSTTSSTSPTPAATSTGPVAKIDKEDIWGEAGSSPTTAVGTSKSSTATATTPAATPSTQTTPVSTTTPLVETPAPTPAIPAPKATPPAPPKTSSVHPVPVADTPWYEASWVKPAALGAGILLLLGGLLGMRKRQTPSVVAGRGSIADSFGRSPLHPAGAPGSLEAEEASLREQMQLDPSNAGLHLELLSIYYAERDVAKFEDAAADMHAHIEDAHQPEWLEAQAMGQELAPSNPLFSDAAHYDDDDAMVASAHADTFEHQRLDGHHEEFVTAPSRLHPHLETHATAPPDEDLGFNISPSDFAAAPVAASGSLAKHDDSFNFTLPPLDLDEPVTHSDHAAAEVAPKAVDLDDDFFHGDDAIGTKLDLAKAYMDMGDPEGARSMLEEVVTEGNDAQKAEAHRLIADIR